MGLAALVVPGAAVDVITYLLAMWDDNLPLDELDPFCQKEIESERRKTSISKELRKTDRSNVRNDLVQTVFGNYGNNNGRCGCCSKPSVDYPLLAQLKKQQQQHYKVL